ncbi:hypothetical protein [Streptomyces sp. NPDC048142]|uniref:hypothetical protein n=1 Tax=Streptomyces sp. NPDC048142 TaxID=3365501 RepID=UPI0037175829
MVSDIDHTLTTTGSAATLATAPGVPADACASAYRAYHRGQLTRAELLALLRGPGRATRENITAAPCSKRPATPSS